MSIRDKPAVCVIGTSNAIYLDGFVKPIRDHPGFSSVDIRAIGHVSSSFFPYWERVVDLAAADICILDFCGNDAAYAASGGCPFAVSREAMAYALTRVAEAGAMPVLLIMPTRHWPADGGEYVRDVLALAAELGVPTFDVHQLLRMRYPDARFEDLFGDWMHLHMPIAREVGQWLSEAIDAFWPVWRSFADAGVAERPGYRHGMVFPDANDSDAFATALRRTSLVAMTEVLIPAGHALTVPIGESGEALGLLVDLAHTTCQFGLEGQGLARFHVDDFETYRVRDLSIAIYPWPPVAARDGNVQVHAFEPALDVPDPALALLGVPWRRRAALRWPRRLPFAIELSAIPRGTTSYVDFRSVGSRPDVHLGWSEAESHGRWSNAERVRIGVTGHAVPAAITLIAAPFLPADRPVQRLVDASDKIIELSGRGYQFVRVDRFGRDGGDIFVDLQLPDAASPKALQVSSDDRTLGFTLLGYFVHASDTPEAAPR